MNLVTIETGASNISTEGANYMTKEVNLKVQSYWTITLWSEQSRRERIMKEEFG